MARDKIKVLIVDDHTVVRKGTQALLAEFDDIDIVGEADNGETALSQAEALQPDIILMDLVMPKMDGIEAIRQIKASQPDCGILALTSFATDDKLFPAIKAGALGYFLKDSPPETLVNAIREVHRGRPSLPPEIASRVLQEFGHAEPDMPKPEKLTSRETEVLELVAQGLQDEDIAQQLSISEGTVRAHVSNILHKLHLANRVQATLHALREGITGLYPPDHNDEKKQGSK